MLMKDFRKLIAPNATLELTSYYTEDPIKTCKAVDLTEDDMKLIIHNIFACSYFNSEKKAYLGMFVLLVGEE